MHALSAGAVLRFAGTLQLHTLRCITSTTQPAAASTRPGGPRRSITVVVWIRCSRTSELQLPVQPAGFIGLAHTLNKGGASYGACQSQRSPQHCATLLQVALSKRSEVIHLTDFPTAPT